MQGRRIPDNTGPHLYKPGDYGLFGGKWYAKTPNDLLGDLSGHEVALHDDGAITASPSILCDQGDVSWHGYLERGVWRKC